MNAPKETYRVTRSNRNWVVERDGCAAPLGSFRSKRDALKHILRVANDASANVHIIGSPRPLAPVKTATYIAILEKEADSDYGVWFPDFPGCVTAGSTLDEVKDMAAEALAFQIEGMRKDGDPIPHPSCLDAVMEDPFASLGIPFLVTVPAPPFRPNRIEVRLPARRIKATDTLEKEAGDSRSGMATLASKTQAEHQPEIEIITLPAEGFVRLNTVLQFIPVSESTWYKHQAAGNVPRPVTIPNITTKLYDVADIRELIARIRGGAAPWVQVQPLPEAESITLPAEGFVRLHTVLQVIPVSISTWYKHQAVGLFPRPVQIPGTTTKLYNVADIRKLMSGIREGA